MKRWITASFILVVLFLGTAVLGWLALPHVIDALPGSIRGRLPEEVIALVTTPLPTALPAPQIGSQNTPFRIVIPTIGPEGATETAPAVSTETPIIETAETVSATEPTPTLAPSSTPSPEPTATEIPPPPSAHIDGMKVIPQKFNNCGPTNLSMTLNYYDETRDQLEIAVVLKPHEDDRNVSPEELVSYVNEQTSLRAEAYSGGDLTLLKHLLAAGFPVIVEKGLIENEAQGWIGHYVTVFGYDDTRQEFDTLDSFLGPWDSSGLPVSYTKMAEYWRHFNHTFVLVFRPEQENQVREILGPIMTDPLLMWQQAALEAQQQLETEPNNAFIWFNLGTNLTHLATLTGQMVYYEGAAAAFDRAREIGLPFRMLWYQFQPYPAYLAVGRYEDVSTLVNAVLSTSGGLDVEETYYYKGKLLEAMGNVSGATVAYQQAVQLNPGYEAAAAALEAVK
ncbi:MAG: C39 family peptidase [Candidatus Promineifilaceae bacterium]